MLAFSSTFDVGYDLASMLATSADSMPAQFKEYMVSRNNGVTAEDSIS